MQYSRGAVIRLALEDFMAYRYVEVRPGPNLNVVVGTNGTGKSSLVCGLCLGLCGTPQHLARAASMAAYIRMGASKARIEIELCNDDGANYVIERTIFPNKSAWKLNGVATTQKSVEAKVASLNIQVSNLCQFLPQDRVAAFVRMSQQELLESTEHAVGTVQLVHMHQRLRELQQGVSEQDASLRAQQSQLNQECQKVEQLGPDMRSLQAYKEVQLRIKLLQQKLAWLEYEEARRAFLEEKKKLQEAEGAVQKQDHEVAQLKRCVDAASRDMAQLSATDKQLGEAAAAQMRKLEASSKRLVELEEQVSSAKRELRRRIQDQEARASRMKADAESIVHIEQEMADLVPDKSEVERVQVDLQQCNLAINHIRRDRAEVDAVIGDRQRESTVVVQQMKRLQDVSNQRMELLRRRSKDAYEAAIWLRQNEGLFKGKVYPPIMTQIDVLDPSDAKYVESQIPNKDLLAFVAEQPGDLNIFLNNVRDNRHLSVNGVVVPPESLDTFQPRRPLSQISQYGFRAYVRSLFTAPEAVMRYLCKRHRVHDIPVGSAATENCLAQVRSLGINRFFTKDNLYTVKVSQYDPSRSLTMSSELGPPSLLTMSVDAAALEELEQRKQVLSEEIAAKMVEVRKLDSEERSLQQQLEELRKAKKRLQENAGRLRQLTVLRDEKRSALQTMQNTAIDLEEERRKTKCQQQDLCSRRIAQVEAHTETLKLCCENRRACAEHRLDMVWAAANRERAEDAHRMAVRQHACLQAEMEGIQQQLSVSQRVVMQKRRQAQEATKSPSTCKQIPPEIVKEFKALPNTVEEISNQLLTEEQTLSCMLPVDVSLEREYQQRKVTIARLEQEVASCERQLVQARAEMAETGTRWQRDVEQLLQRVNTSFSRFFRELGCVGEVSLSRGPDPELYDKYGVSIRVKFRDEAPLAELSTIHQSGGERSVATVLYMMALQEQTTVPFRVVDEINQGMDSDNERKVFEMMMKTAAKNSAQYLLLTPKLLPDLPYTKDVTMTFLTLVDCSIMGDLDVLAGSPVGLLRAA